MCAVRRAPGLNLVSLQTTPQILMNKSRQAFLFSTQTLGKHSLYMWTFTFAEVLDIKDTRKRWNYLLTLLRRRWPDLCGLRVFELHQSHGLHVHLVTNRFIDVNEARKLSNKAGWGRIHVARISTEKSVYLAKYLPIDQRGADLFFQVISARYERGSIVLTTNKAFKQWPSIFNGDSTITSAVLDRLLHHAETVVIEGSSYRMKDRIEA